MRIATQYVQTAAEPQLWGAGGLGRSCGAQAAGPQLLTATMSARAGAPSSLVQTPRVHRHQQATTTSPARAAEVQAVQRSAASSGQASMAPLVTPRSGVPPLPLGMPPLSPRHSSAEACSGAAPQCTSVSPALAQQLLLQGGRMSSRVTIGSCSAAGGVHPVAVQQWAQAPARQPQPHTAVVQQTTLHEAPAWQPPSHTAVVQTARAPQPQPQSQAPSPGQGIRRLQSAPAPLPHSWYPTRTAPASPVGYQVQGAPDAAHIATLEEELDEREEVPEEVGDGARVRALLLELDETRRERDDLRRERDSLLQELRGGRPRNDGPTVPPLPMGSRASLQAVESHSPLSNSLVQHTVQHTASASHFGQDDTLEVLVSVPRAFTDAELQETAKERYVLTPRGDVMLQSTSAAAVLAGVREDM